ncbi:MAG TPA: hypothetical protein H9902_07925 [Candidatus Stackebrandtia faecavium]|nr:hypothetical protein [Candidatus Stackebrandtia faecavium]
MGSQRPGTSSGLARREVTLRQAGYGRVGDASPEVGPVGDPLGLGEGLPDSVGSLGDSLGLPVGSVVGSGSSLGLGVGSEGMPGLGESDVESDSSGWLGDGLEELDERDVEGFGSDGCRAFKDPSPNGRLPS